MTIIFPVYEEDSARLGAGIAATWQSLATKHPQVGRLFDICILSDSSSLENSICEQDMVLHLREALPSGRFHYRRRITNRNAKMGNVIDFCRRWGASYDYMLVMDADSVMDGDAMPSCCG